MAEVGTVYVNVAPSTKGFVSKLTGAGKSGGASSGNAFNMSFGKLVGGTAIGNILAKGIAAATGAISSSMGAAISRVDTLNNFPKVMANLGYSAEDASRSITTLSAGIDGMPTSLDGIVSMTQQLAPLCGGLDQATELSLAMNNMMLASGASTADQSRAMQQYTQMLARGKVELNDWRTLQEVMPGQLNQVAQAMLGAGKNSTDLYEALKNGTVSMDDFNEAVLRLNSEGINGFASFEEQARTATEGIGTAMENVQNRIGKAIGKVIDHIGQANISGAINSLSSQFGSIADVFIEMWDSMVARIDFAGFETAFNGIGEALGRVFGQGDVAASFGDQVGQLINGLIPIIQDATPIIEGLANALKFVAENLNWIVPLIVTLWVSFQGTQLIATASGFLGSFASAAGGAGAAAGVSAGQILAIGAAALMIGAGIALACLGFALLAQSAIALSDAGGAAIAVFFGMFAAIGVLMGLAALLGPALNIAAVGMLAFGAAILMAGAGAALLGAGIALAGVGFTLIASSGQQAAAAMMVLAPAMLLIAPTLAVMGAGALVAGAGLLVLGAGALVAGAGGMVLAAALTLAGAGLMVMAAGLTTMAGAAASGAAAMTMLTAPVALFGASSLVCGAGALVAGAGLVVMGAGATVAGAGLTVLAAGLTLAAAGVTLLAGGVALVAAGCTAMGVGLLSAGTGLALIAANGAAAAAALMPLSGAAIVAAPGIAAIAPAATASGAAMVALTAGLVAGSAALVATTASSAALVAALMTLSTGVRSAQSNVSGATNRMKSDFDSLQQKILSSTQAAGTAITSFVNNAKAELDSLASAIASYDFTINVKVGALPHFSFSGSFNPETGEVPSVNVSWYANGAIFNGASLIGVGEAGPEAVLPLDNASATRPLSEQIADVVEERTAERDNQMLDIMAAMLSMMRRIYEVIPAGTSDRQFQRNVRKAVSYAG